MYIHVCIAMFMFMFVFIHRFPRADRQAPHALRVSSRRDPRAPQIIFHAFGVQGCGV